MRAAHDEQVEEKVALSGSRKGKSAKTREKIMKIEKKSEREKKRVNTKNISNHFFFSQSEKKGEMKKNSSAAAASSPSAAVLRTLEKLPAFLRPPEDTVRYAAVFLDVISRERLLVR